MNAEVNRVLRQIASKLESAGRERARMRKCAGCGCDLAAGEGVQAGDGGLLCEACGKSMGEAKKPKAGSGKRFKTLVKDLEKRGDVEDPKALAAWIGRKKYGAEKFSKMAAQGRK